MTLVEVNNPIRVSIQQFYGIEINDFAVTVAKTALWIAESQMLEETKNIVYGFNDDFLPLKTYVNITEGNALRIDWNDVIPAEKLSFIMGNPPFVGARWMASEQKEDVEKIFEGWKSIGNLDYVSCWYKKAADYMGNYNIRAALVSTNSITQGESVSILWKPLFESGVHIDFAYRTFIWDSEASIKAHVHCVIVGFSRAVNNKQKIIYSGENAIPANNINGYLLDAENIFIEKRMKPLCNVPEIALGGQAIDGGFLILTEEEKEEFLEKEPQASPFFRHYMMGKDFIDRKPRYCIWLVGADPGLLKKCPMILERVNKVREFRLSSTRANTKKAAENPTLFASILEHKNQYIAIPKVSSQNRRYIPMDYLDGEIIPGDKLFTKLVFKKSFFIFLIGFIVFSIIGLMMKSISYSLGFLLGYLFNLAIFYVIIITSDMILNLKRSTSLIILLNIVKLAIYAIGFLIAIFIPKWFNLMGVLFGYMVIKITIYIVSYQMKGVKG